MSLSLGGKNTEAALSLYPKAKVRMVEGSFKFRK